MNWFASIFGNSQNKQQIQYDKHNNENTMVAIIDTETTGLSRNDEPVSIGIILLEVETDTGEIIREVDSYYGLREPRVQIHPRAKAVHGITHETLRGKTFDLKRIKQCIKSADLLVAHNATFDRRMLSRIIPSVMNANWACSMYTLKYDWAIISTKGSSLDAICSALNIVRQTPHNALNDCRALQAVLMEKAGKTNRSKKFMARLIANAWVPDP